MKVTRFHNLLMCFAIVMCIANLIISIILIRDINSAKIEIEVIKGSLCYALEKQGLPTSQFEETISGTLYEYENEIEYKSKTE